MHGYEKINIIEVMEELLCRDNNWMNSKTKARSTGSRVELSRSKATKKAREQDGGARPSKRRKYELIGGGWGVKTTENGAKTTLGMRLHDIRERIRSNKKEDDQVAPENKEGEEDDQEVMTIPDQDDQNSLLPPSTPDLSRPGAGVCKERVENMNSPPPDHPDVLDQSTRPGELSGETPGCIDMQENTVSKDDDQIVGLQNGEGELMISNACEGILTDDLKDANGKWTRNTKTGIYGNKNTKVTKLICIVRNGGQEAPKIATTTINRAVGNNLAGRVNNQFDEKEVSRTK